MLHGDNAKAAVERDGFGLPFPTSRVFCTKRPSGVDDIASYALACILAVIAPPGIHQRFIVRKSVTGVLLIAHRPARFVALAPHRHWASRNSFRPNFQTPRRPTTFAPPRGR